MPVASRFFAGGSLGAMQGTRPPPASEPSVPGATDLAGSDPAGSDLAGSDPAGSDLAGSDPGRQRPPSGSSALRRGLRWGARWAPLHAVVAVILTWPLAAHLTDSLPAGVENEQTVPLFNLWTLRWNQEQIGDLFRHYWDAPIFHPTPGAFALSEPQPLTGLFFAPIAWVTRNPVLAYDVTLLTILTLNGLAAARLARRLGAGRWPAALAGVLAQALPFVGNQLGVLQLTVLFPIFFLVDAVIAWAGDGPRPRAWAAATGLWLAVTFLTCGYYGLFSTLVVGLAALAFARRDWLSWARLAQVGIALAAFALPAVPFLLGQAHYTSAYSRSADTIRALSALPADYARLHPSARGGSLAPWLLDEGGTDHWLYPGTALLALAIAGAVVAARRATAAPDAGARSRRRREVLFLEVGLLLALVLSFGLRFEIGDASPYSLLRDHVPGFQDLRSPYRFSVLVQIFLVPLAAFALDALWSWVPSRAAGAAEGPTPASGDRRGPADGLRLGAVATVVVVLLGVVEVSKAPERLFVAPASAATTSTDPAAVEDWVTWLREHQGDLRSGDGSVANVPFPANGSAAAYEETVKWMLDGLDHEHPVVNGYSGLFPRQYEELEAAMRGFPSITSVRRLREAGVTFVVVDRSWLTPEAQGWMAEWSAELEPVFQGRDHVVYELHR